MKNIKLKKLVTASLLVALAVVGSTFSFPVFFSRCAPVQHIVNIFAAVGLGPFYGVVIAFLASFLRNALGLGSLTYGKICCIFSYLYLYPAFFYINYRRNYNCFANIGKA